MARGGMLTTKKQTGFPIVPPLAQDQADLVQVECKDAKGKHIGACIFPRYNRRLCLAGRLDSAPAARFS